MKEIKEPMDRALVYAVFAKLDPVAMMGATASVFCLGLVFMTASLLLQGGSPDFPVGAHLGLLGLYLPGYDVTWFGCIIGGFYAAIIGGIVGFFIALLWNLTHYLYLAAIVNRLNYFSD